MSAYRNAKEGYDELVECQSVLQDAHRNILRTRATIAKQLGCSGSGSLHKSQELKDLLGQLDAAEKATNEAIKINARDIEQYQEFLEDIAEIESVIRRLNLEGRYIEYVEANENKISRRERLYFRIWEMHMPMDQEHFRSLDDVNNQFDHIFGLRTSDRPIREVLVEYLASVKNLKSTSDPTELMFNPQVFIRIEREAAFRLKKIGA